MSCRAWKAVEEEVGWEMAFLCSYKSDLENKGGCAMEEGDQMSLLPGDAETKGCELRDRSGSGDNGAGGRDRPRTGGDWGPDALSLL